MSSGLRLCILVAVATYFLPVNGGFWNWGSSWSEEVPTNCPHENNETHVCSTLESSVGICITIDCCEQSEDDEDEERIDESESAEGSSEMGHHGGHHGGRHGNHHGSQCSVCMFIRTCDLYKCYRSCCDGYERNFYGGCSNKTGNLQCENGGVLRRSWWGEVYCKCPWGFKGHNCEIPICKCENGGECIVKDGKPYCNCSFGYYGDKCETSNCTMSCDNGGKCYKYGDKEFCWCQDNFIGSQCQQHYTNPDTCPSHDDVTDMCEYSCMKSSDCEENHVCCKEGCSSVCRKVKPETCLHEGRSYAINSTYSPDPCTTCTCSDNGEMLCSSVSCAYPDCLYGEPTVIPGQCCPSCPDKPNPPKIYNCPTSVVYLNTKPVSDQAWLDDRTNITARDSEDNALLVKYRPDKVHHCHCAPSANSQTLVQAYAMDMYDFVATCSFNVIVRDTFPPRFKYCPKDISVSENEVIFWSLPDYEDNVGIARVMVPDKQSGDKFPVGRHALSYSVWDHDGNRASCNFTVSVTRDPPRIDHCPTDVIHLNTSYYTDYAILSELSTGLQAFDSEDNKIQVQYEPQTVHHCRCSDSRDKVNSVTAMATDHYGKHVTCTFKVIVQDIYQPKFTYCQEDLSVSEGETVTWMDPTYTDNVGIGKTEQVGQPGVLPVGKNTVKYNIWDHDGNKATCQFQVYVEERMPPKINNCPNEVLILNTPPINDKVELSDSIASVTAFDEDGKQLEVSFQPSSIRHCHCYNSAGNETLVEATARDRYGNIVTCSFKVVVVDQVKPVVTYCPEDINVVEYEVVTWKNVEYFDNVEVARTSVTGRKSGSAFPVGNHGVSFEFWDFDGNSAICQFNVIVAKAECTLECFHGGMCHTDSVTQVCRCPPNYYGKQCEHKYIHTYCEHKGRRYSVDETYSPDPCSTCTCVNTGKMVCATVQCATPNCPGGRKLVSKPGHCCLECPEERRPRISCPSHTVHVNTTAYSNKTILDHTNTYVEAFDSSNHRLQVFYQPSYIHHCKCHKPSGHESMVQAHAVDKYGSSATCSFKVIVRDVHPPKLFSCPENMYLFENEIVEWTEPKATDNVGVAGSECTSKQNGKVFPLGEHRISCDVWDYERNKASCYFHVIVIKEDTPVEDMPLGHRERYTGHRKSKLRLILPPIFGAVALAGVAILLFCICKRKCKPRLSQKKSHKPARRENIYAEPGDIDSKLSVKSKRLSKSTSSTASSKTVSSRNLAYSTIYGVHGDPGSRPPPYTLHPYSPPPYSISGSVKDVTYMSLPLPSYTNPEYESLSVHRSSVYSPSVMSVSTVASRSSKARSTKSSAKSVRSSKSASSNYRA